MKVKHRAAKALSFALAATMVLSSGSMAFADTGGEAEPVVTAEDAAQSSGQPVAAENSSSGDAAKSDAEAPAKDPAASEQPAAGSSSSSSASSGSSPSPAEKTSSDSAAAESAAAPGQDPSSEAAGQPSQTDNGVATQSIETEEPALITYEFYASGKKISSQTVKNGDSLREPEATFVKGSKFIGWVIDGTPFTAFGKQSGITETRTIRVDAKYETICYVYFMDGTGSSARVIRTKEGLPGTAVSTSDVTFAVGTDESITGWYTDPSLSQSASGVTFAEEDIYLYPKVEKGFWITCKSDGGTYIAPKFYSAGSTASAPAVPAKAGYTFAGWYLDQALNQAADFAEITKSTTVYAKWTPAKNTQYTVIHWLENADDDKYSSKDIEALKGTTGTETAAKSKAYKGFTAKKIQQKEIAGDGSTIINVYYSRNIYEVKFYSMNGRTEYTALKISAKYGANISDKWPTYNGSSTWSVTKRDRDDRGNGGPYQVNIDVMPLNGATFYGPKTGKGSETAFYYVEVLPGETGTVTGGKTTYTLHHKDTSPGTDYYVTDEDKYPITGFTYSHGTKNHDRYNNAKFYYSRNSYDIVFINSGAKDKVVTKKYQQSITDAAYTPKAPAGKEDWHFDGWYDNELGQGDKYVFTGRTMPAQSITLYAKWSAPTYTVTAHGTTDEAVKVARGGQVSEEDFDAAKPALADGERWMGWALRSGSDGDYVYTPFNYATEINQNYDLYPYILNASSFTVTYDAGDGSGTVPSDSRSYAKDSKARVKSKGSDLKGPDNAPRFLGWKSSVDGKIYQPGDKITITGNTTLTAQWGEAEVETSVIYKPGDGAEGSDKTFALKNNGSHTVLDVTADSIGFTKKGYRFTGWQYTDKNGRTAIAKPGQVIWLDTEDPQPNVLTAQWEAKKATVTVTGNHDTKVYNGEEQSVSGFTTDAGGKDIHVALKDGHKAVASGVDADHYAMGLTAADFTATSDSYAEITIIVKDGGLTITPVSEAVIVKITGHKDRVEFDGEEHSVTGYDVDSISNELYHEEDFVFNGSAAASGTDEGTYLMGLAASDFENRSGNFAKVLFEVTDGELIIDPAKIPPEVPEEPKDPEDPKPPASLDTPTGPAAQQTIASSPKAALAHAVKTGDEANIALYTLLALLAASGASVSVIRRKS